LHSELESAGKRQVIAIECEADFFFVDPHPSRQRGSIKQGNRLARDCYLPSGTDFATVSDERFA